MELQNTITLIAACLGFITLSKFLLKILIWIWIMFFRPAKNLKGYGSWALVTGSTDGIGRALAFELASKGINLILIGRTPLKLQVISNEIVQKYCGVAIKTVVIDFASCRGEEIARIIEEEIKGLDLGILINNAGLAYPYARFFNEVDSELMESVLRVNLEGTTWVTKSVIPGMLKKKQGAIINIGSASSACLPSYPLYTIYAATKAYVAMLSKSISLEYKQHGIDVQCQIPLFVATKMIPFKKCSVFIPSPEAYGKASIRWIGHRDQICIPYWSHALQACILSLFPESLVDWCVFRYFLWFWARELRKDSRISHLKY